MKNRGNVNEHREFGFQTQHMVFFDAIATVKDSAC